MRNIEFASNEHYHLFNRGTRSDNIFLDDGDRIRFVFLILHLQSDISLFHITKNIGSFQKYKTFTPHRSTASAIVSKRTVELVNFALMSNHFHLTVKEIAEGGISKYMHRVLTSYSKYFNKKYSRVGHLFESTFKAVHVESNTQLLHLSAYIHKNPKEIKEWRGREWEYPWSSLSDYVRENRFGELLQSDIVLGQFATKNDYKKFIETSKAKEIENQLDGEHFFEE